MTPGQNGTLIAVPNVLRDQTAPNTLAGLRLAPARSTRIQLPLGMLAAAVVALAVLVSIVASHAL